MNILRWSLLVGLLTATPALALTPPMDDAVLEAQADLIVQGHTDAPIRCWAKSHAVETGRLSYYALPLTIDKVFKGDAKPGDRVSLRFIFNHYKRGYSGDQDAVHSPGEVAKYFLRRDDKPLDRPDGGHPATTQPTGMARPVRLVHWSGVTVQTAGKGSLPPCR